MSTLDKEAEDLNKIDLRWIDVQGAEDRALKGGNKTLPRVAAVFLEATLVDSPYQGTLLFAELDPIPSGFGFLCVGLGQTAWNYSGNALWIRDAARRALFRKANSKQTV